MRTTMVLLLSLFSLGLMTAVHSQSTREAQNLVKAQILDFRGVGNLVDGPYAITGTGIPYPSYESIEQDLNNLSAKYPAQAELIQYGRTTGGLNLNLLRIARRDIRPERRMAVQISGAIHGNEYLGIEDKLAAHFLEKQDLMPGLQAFLKKGGIVYFIPIINPDGFVRKERLNSNRADLNRDFDLLPLKDARFSQPETRALADYLDRDLAQSGADLALTLDYHCCVPAVITPWTYINAQPEPEDQETFHTLGGIGKKTLGYKYGNAMQTVYYNAEGSSIDYFYAKYGSRALAIEGQWWGEQGKFRDHVAFWDQTFMWLANER